MTRRLLIFDLDGTLVDSRGDLTAAVNAMRRHYGLQPLPLEIVSGYVGGGARNLVECALQRSKVDVDEALEFYKSFYNANLTAHTTTYEGVGDGLPALLRAGHELAVLSNKPGDASRAILQHFGLDACFRDVIGGGDISDLKPHPAGIHRLMADCSIGAADTWMIGDHHTDIAAAKNAGVFSALVEYGFGNSGDFTANSSFASFSGLVEFFR